jgi:hypothetical protein
MEEEEEEKEDRDREADWKGTETDDSELKKTRIGIPGLY